MCLGLPAKVVSIDGNSSNVEMMGVTNKISIELLENVQVGDYVLVHAGCAIQVLDEEEALRTIDIFNEIKELGIK
ncbi:hydrogenase assembly chaperone hypC/hupF [Ruminiclostridium papyrosolvens DSM 2782]|uniref:Hydrogenase assembly chaperone hypC/hupF n=1 Tax=Ruminiclostridium papyrosolvens DSM 2782 TaxID=588581 RepID=F1TG55_9FIRM|nr:HypC/HybG/HupF family hydrogenase formation chaperone [Ruminiclostridium papyrosolvens]EGD46674.1 hydrogenase assembly chaperone hypC/hupF [Ruminiclostridium papyrosolvens DSM 2782]WES35825.1 HypC/HybG/HupF family hydrogenase formation chaperone [Ruminiclostridium papyrosolvens DSM 2782]